MESGVSTCREKAEPVAVGIPAPKLKSNTSSGCKLGVETFASVERSCFYTIRTRKICCVFLFSKTDAFSTTRLTSSERLGFDDVVATLLLVGVLVKELDDLFILPTDSIDIIELCLLENGWWFAPFCSLSCNLWFSSNCCWLTTATAVKGSSRACEVKADDGVDNEEGGFAWDGDVEIIDALDA